MKQEFPQLYYDFRRSYVDTIPIFESDMEYFWTFLSD